MLNMLDMQLRLEAVVIDNTEAKFTTWTGIAVSIWT